MAAEWREKFREHPAGKALIPALWLQIYMPWSFPIFWRLGCTVAFFFVVLIVRRWGGDTPKTACVIAALLVSIFFFVLVHVGFQASIAHALVSALLLGMIAGIVRMFTVPPLSQSALH